MSKNTEPKKLGRPGSFSQEIADRICELVSDGKLLTHICDKNNPDYVGVSRVTVYSWRIAYPEFLNAYAKALENQQMTFADEILMIAADQSRDYQEQEIVTQSAKNGTTITTKTVSDNTAVQRDRLRVDSMKFLMARLASNTFGEKIKQELTGAEGAPLVPVINMTIKKAE